MSDLVSASRIEELLPGEAGIWLILERHPRTFERLYALESSPDIAWLFHDTRFTTLADQSPLVVSVSPGSALLEEFAIGRGTLPLEGILVTSMAEPKQVLAHLRERLQIRFYGKRQAMLRYYDPWIAASFFSADNARDTWLGPLERVIWFGGNFLQRAHQGACWYACRGAPEEAATVASDNAVTLGLSPAQERRLEEFVAHYPLWRYLAENVSLDETSAVHASRFISSLSEAERLSIPQQDLADFVALRFEHHYTPLPDTIMEQPAVERLAVLSQDLDMKEDETTIGRNRA